MAFVSAPTTLLRILKVRFIGWTEPMVPLSE